MDEQSLKFERTNRHRITKESGSFDVFAALVSRETKIADWPYADSVEKNIPIYSAEKLVDCYGRSDEREPLLAELAEVLSSGPGVIAVKGAISDHSVIDDATSIFEQIIEDQKRTNQGSGDHFAKPGANDRIWNAVEKHCLADPANFILYYSSQGLAIPCESWLGRGYQMTAQVNRVNPGGGAQKAHRDYHLGFMVPEQMEKYPGHVHKLSPMLTLQGALAHCDMPIESGPTQLLPYSQQFLEGYLAFGREEFQEYFADNHVQLPLEKGDAVFFNPALMHAAGSNRTTDIYRMANLFQISSPFGRAMETVNHSRMVKAAYPELLKIRKSGTLSNSALECAIESLTEGYPFPTNLDIDPPIGGLAPKSQSALLREALRDGMEFKEFCRTIDEHTSKRSVLP